MVAIMTKKPAPSTPLLRAAEKRDAPELAELVNIAGEGLPLYLWDQMRGPGETAWDVGRSRAAREGSGFSYRNAYVIEVEGCIAAALVGYPLAEDPDPIDYAQTPPLFIPLLELEALAPGSWYVNVLAGYPEWRNRGFGASLLRHAEQLARESGIKQTSIIVSNGNEGALRLYEREGYRRAAERPMAKEGPAIAGTHWVLMTKAVA